MGKRDKRVDAIIAKSPDFAKPIMKHVRELVHEGCPDVEETVKWGHASFTYHGILCGMAAFKEHAAFGFWKGSIILGKDGKAVEDAYGNFGKLTKVSDLPPKKVLIGYVKQAMKLNETGTNVPKPKGKPKPKIPVPADLTAALKKNKKAAATFEGFSPSNQREYLEWITEAKQEATRKRRLEQAVIWMAEGKVRNWKYMDC